MYSDLRFISPDRIKLNEPMSRHTYFKIGGPVDVMVLPDSIEEIVRVLDYCREKSISCFVFGMGSNILVKDKGIRGIAIKLGDSFKKITRLGENLLLAEAGVTLAQLCEFAANHSLSGLEFAEGIPGSVGGAIVMNAGAYGGEMKDVLVKVSALTPEGELVTLTGEDIKPGYRKTVFQNNGYIVLSAYIKLRPGNKEEIYSQMKQYSEQRRLKQPLEYPSAGSTFRRPEGVYVGPLIEQLGLKGFSIGDAQVSAKHAGFIINKGKATADDVIKLISYIQEKAQRELGIILETEIKIVGE
jgi:UDP-N-acetylmuramate dehydrogenase